MLNLALFEDFILYLHVWIQTRLRVHKPPKYGSNTDPDPQHWVTVKVLTVV